MTANLGMLLAANIHREKLAESDKAAALEQKRTAEAKAAFEKVADFFEKAKKQFTEGITSGTPVKDLFLQIGGRGYSNCSDCHEDVDTVIQGFRCKDQKLGPDSLQNSQQFGPLWIDFQKWANAEGLAASWHYCWDGGGMSSWWQLRVAPAKTNGQ